MEHMSGFSTFRDIVVPLYRHHDSDAIIIRKGKLRSPRGQLKLIIVVTVLIQERVSIDCPRRMLTHFCAIRIMQHLVCVSGEKEVPILWNGLEMV